MFIGVAPRTRLAFLTLAPVVAMPPFAHAQQPATATAVARLPRDIPAGPVEVILRRIATDTDQQILFDPRLVARLRAQPLARGTPLPVALAQVLRDHRLAARRAAPGLLVIEPLPVRDTATAAAPPPPEGDIVVTALRHPTLLRDTDGSLRVIAGDRLELRGIRTLAGLSRALPALGATNTGPMQQRLAIRGVTGPGESTVGVYYGETPVSAPSGTGFDPGALTPDIDLIDVDRVELLRGPQGTLYGAGSMGGTLRTLFREPDAERMAGQVSVDGGITTHGGANAGMAGMLNVPLVADRLALRVVAGRRRDSGVIDNVRLGIADTDAVTRESERIAIAWTPDDDYRLDVLALRQANAIDDAGLSLRAAGRLATDAPVRLPNRERLALFGLTQHWSTGNLRVVSSLSHYRWRVERRTDFTNVLRQQNDSDRACLRYAASIGGQGCDNAMRAAFRAYLASRLPAILYQPMTVESTSAELRAGSDGNAPLRWTAGVFVEHRADAVSSYTVRADPGSGAMIVPLDVTGLRRIDTTLNQQAVFAEVERPVGAGLTATLGGRLYRYRRTAGGVVPVANIITGTASAAAQYYHAIDTGANLKAQLSWRSGGGTIVYALASQGFRPGGVNITPELDDARRSYRADRLWNYEIGVRAPSLPVAGLSLEGGLFHIDWYDTIFVANSANGAFLYNTNLSGVAIDGAELRLVYTAGGVRLAAEAAFNDARLTSDTYIGTSDGVGRRGDRLPNVPQMAWSASAEWHGAGGIALGVAATGTNGFDSAFPDSPYRERTPSRLLIDAWLRWQSGPWQAALGIENLRDSLAPSRIASSAFGMGQRNPARPRTVSLTLTRSFD